MQNNGELEESLQEAPKTLKARMEVTAGVSADFGSVSEAVKGSHPCWLVCMGLARQLKAGKDFQGLSTRAVKGPREVARGVGG